MHILTTMSKGSFNYASFIKPVLLQHLLRRCVFKINQNREKLVHKAPVTLFMFHILQWRWQQKQNVRTDNRSQAVVYFYSLISLHVFTLKNSLTFLADTVHLDKGHSLFTGHFGVAFLSKCPCPAPFVVRGGPLRWQWCHLSLGGTPQSDLWSGKTDELLLPPCFFARSILHVGVCFMNDGDLLKPSIQLPKDTALAPVAPTRQE